MLCAISGESPQIPVVSRKSGNIYEKRLIEAYIIENGSEPTTGEPLAIEDLLAVQTSHTIPPRPPTLTSIPALLGVFQEEWDALALQTFTLQQNLAQARQELSTVLYQHDAAIRVISRLTKERDDARDALSKIDIGRGAGTTNGSQLESMQIDNAPLPDNISAKVDSTQESLSKTRRKRPIPEGWATPDDISNFEISSTTDSIFPGLDFLALNSTGDLALIGGTEGIAAIYSTSQSQIVQTLQIGNGMATAGVWAGTKAIVSTSAGAIKIFDRGNEIASLVAHSSQVTGVSLHPCGDILASASSDNSYVLYDIGSQHILTQVYSDSGLSCTQFHPDGHLITTGGTDGEIRFHDVKTGSLLGSFDTGSAISSICYSENGTWIAAANVGSPIVTIWDLRKVGQSTEPIKSIETSSPVVSLDWDYTAQYLLVGGLASTSIQQYVKSSKQWMQPLDLAIPGIAVAWGPSARTILAANKDGKIVTLA